MIRSVALSSRIVAAATAATAIAGLVLQFALMAKTMPVDEALWRFIGYFTLLTNTLVAVVAGAVAIAPGSRLARPRWLLVALVAILGVGLVYSLALRALWSPVGLQAVADHILHDATPILFAALWLSAPHGRLSWRDAPWGLAWPLAYCAYALARGAVDGWYAYWFLDPTALAAGPMAVNIAILAAAFLALAMMVVAIDRVIARLTGVDPHSGRVKSDSHG